MTFKRLTHCPRCNTKAKGVYPHDVEKPSEPKMFVQADPSESATFDTEEWYRYEPCGCVIPPEEHDELIDEHD